MMSFLVVDPKSGRALERESTDPPKYAWSTLRFGTPWRVQDALTLADITFEMGLADRLRIVPDYYQRQPEVL